jgi:hypothetical protein
MICGDKSGDNCSSVSLDPLSYPPDDLKSELFSSSFNFRRYASFKEEICCNFSSM